MLNLQLAISRALSTARQQIIFIVSLLLPGAAAVKKQFSETVIVSPIEWPRRCPGAGAASEAAAPRQRHLSSPTSAVFSLPRASRGEAGRAGQEGCRAPCPPAAARQAPGGGPGSATLCKAPVGRASGFTGVRR